MRTKDQILKHIEDAYKEQPTQYERSIISQNILIEVMIDIRDEISVVKKDLVDLNEYLSEHA